MTYAMLKSESNLFNIYASNWWKILNQDPRNILYSYAEPKDNEFKSTSL